MCPEFVFALILNRFALSVSLLTGLPGFDAGRVSKTHIWINCNSFLFYFLVCKNVITRESSLALFGSGRLWSLGSALVSVGH